MAPKHSKASKKSDYGTGTSKTKRKNSSKRSFRGVVDDDGNSLKPLDRYEDTLSDEENFESLGLPKSFTPEMSDDEVYEDQDEDSEEEDEEDRVNWGKKLKNYYVDGSDDDSDEEAINDRIEEAKKITSELYENVEDEDADIENYDLADHKEDPIAFDSLLQNLSESLNVQRETTELPEDFFGLNDKDKKDFISNEHPEFLELLREFKEKSDISNQQIMKLLDNPDSLKLCTKDGMEYLDIRNELLLMYVSYLTYYLLLKTHGISIENHPVINRLLELRIMLDKAKPIESRLQYQITKLLEDQDSEVDTAQLRSRLDLMEDEEDNSSIYKPPKHAVLSEMVPSNVLTEQTTKQLKEGLRNRKRASYTEGEEDGDNDVLATKAAKFMKKMAERERYEMESMRRLPMNKKAKKEMRMFAREQKNMLSGCSLQHLSSFASDAMRTSNKALSVSAGLNAAAQRMRQNILMSERNNILKAPSVSTHNKRKLQHQDIISEPTSKVTFDDEITRIKNIHAKEKLKQTNKVLKPRPDEIVPGKRDIGKDIMKNKGLTVKRDKTKGNARVSNRKKFEKKQKIFNAVNASRRSEGHSYSGEETGINVKKKKSLTM